MVPLLEPAHELVNELSVSSSVASRLDAVKKTTPEFVHKKLEAMATLLAQDEMYKAVSNAGNLVGKQKYGSQGQKSSFSAWMSIFYHLFHSLLIYRYTSPDSLPPVRETARYHVKLSYSGSLSILLY